MASGDYPFIDIAALDSVRAKFAGGASIIVITADLGTIIWANGPGAALFGHNDVETAIGADPGLGKLARRQITALPNFPAVHEGTTVALRIDSRLNSRVVIMQAGSLVLPGGESALVLAAEPAASQRTPEARAKSAIEGFTRAGHHAAFLDQAAHIVACTDGFNSLGLSAETLANLVAEVAGEKDRIVKRLVRIARGRAPAGIVRLTDDPADHLLVVVADEDTLGSYDQQPDALKAAEAPVEKKPAEIETRKEAAEHRPLWRESAQHEGKPLPAMEIGGHPEFKPAQNQAEKPAAPERYRDAGIPAAPPAKAETSGAPADMKRPIRFVWKTDVDAKIIEISDEFVAAVGEKTGAITGHTFGTIASDLGLDPDGEIVALLQRRDTWSGRSVSWPVSSSDMQVPVDLAALPVYDRDRNFMGFRGFGVARMNEIQADPAGRGMTFSGFGIAAERNAGIVQEIHEVPSEAEAPAESGDSANTGQEEAAAPFGKRRPAIADNDDPFRGEVPALNIEETPLRRGTDKIVDLQQKRRAIPDPLAEKIEKSGLSDTERSAFRQIADRLRRETENAPPAPAVFGKRQNAAPSADDAREQETAPASEKTKNRLEPVTQSATQEISGTESLHEEPAREEVAAKTRPAPALRPNPVPSAFSGIWRLFRAQMADDSVLMQLPVPVMVYNERGVVFANNALLTLSGYQDVGMLNREGGVDALFPQHAVTHDGDDDSLLNLLHRDGHEIPIEAHLNSVDWEGEKSLALSMRVSRAVQAADAPGTGAERDLQAHVDELVSILDTATDGVITISEDMSIRSINRSAEALFGYESEEVVGKPFADLFATESRQIASDYVSGLSGDGVASLLNDGREVIGREAHGRFIPLFMTVGKLAGSAGYCAVLRDITHWKQAESELTEARRLAEKSSSQKTEFLARISHEIRTPLNAIIGFSELMLDEKFGPVGNERYRDYLKDINRSGNHVLDLVNDLLDISKIEAGEMELDYEAVHLNDALAEAIAMMQPQANRERVIVRSSLASNLPEVVADLRSVRQIALNLLSNAIRYTLAGGQVIVSTTYDADGSVVLRVRDTGVGMSQAEIGQALKPFRQISALKRKHDRGTGLGLPLTKAMVEANRAKFSISSTPGEGTMVEIIFPPTRVLAD